MSRRLAWLGCALSIVLGAGNASAQDEEETDFAGRSAAAEEEGPPRAADDTDPRELENTDYFFLGALYRQVFIPGFIQRVAPIEGGGDYDNSGTGLSFTYRRNNFGVTANAFWNQARGEGFYRETNDPRTETEYVLADLGVVFFTAEFMWSVPIVDWFAIELGFDLGFGVVYGSVTRTEAYESSPGADDWRPCQGPGDPSSGLYCEPAGGQYGFQETNWLGNGNIPVIVPWISVPHIALRFKPIRQLQIRIDGGWGIYNFFVGGSLAYGF